MERCRLVYNITADFIVIGCFHRLFGLTSLWSRLRLRKKEHPRLVKSLKKTVCLYRQIM